MTFIIPTSSIAESSIPEVALPLVALGLAVPVAPTSLTATADGTNPQYVDLAWTASASAPVTGYKVFRALGGSGSYSQIGTTAATSYDDDTTSASTEYDYYVVAYNNAGDSAASNVDTITTGTAATLPPDDDPSIISYWLTEEGTGTTVADSVGAYDGTGSNLLWVSDGPFGSNAGSFTAGTTRYVSFSDINAMDGLAATTILWWQRLRDIATNQKRIMNKTVSSSNRLFAMDVWDDGVTYLSHQSSAPTSRMTYVSADTFTVSQWQMCCIVYDGSLANSLRMKLYVDGVLKSGTVVGTIPTTSPSNSASWIWGATSGTGNNQDMGPMVIYDEAKDSSWVTDRYNDWGGV